MAFHHEFVVNYVVLYVWGVLLVLLLFLLLLAALLLLFLVLAEISDLLYADDLGQLGANFLADLLGLLEPVLHSNFLAIELLNEGKGTYLGFHSRELILLTPILRISSISWPNPSVSLTLRLISWATTNPG